ncbi:MAG TPA: type II toxin-antitoxin system VapC family toxin [Rhodoferax sp.]|nr:type II toxin-antitoxin system VapC family toxin [Rhodoferax sp.]
MKYLLDTDTLIYTFKRAGNCLARLSQQPDADLAVSCINLFELEFGMVKSNNHTLMERYLREICSRYTVLDFDHAAARQGGLVRAHLQSLGTPIGPYDVQVAGVALSRRLTLVTRNTREFDRVPDLRVENWYD